MRLDRSVRTFGVLAAALAVGVSGCGESATHRFHRQLLPLQRRVDQDKAQISATLRQVRRHNRTDVRILNREIDVLARDMNVIATLTVPPTGAGAFAHYTQANRQLVRALRRFAQLLLHGSTAQLNAQSQRAQAAVGATIRSNDALMTALGS